MELSSLTVCCVRRVRPSSLTLRLCKSGYSARCCRSSSPLSQRACCLRLIPCRPLDALRLLVVDAHGFGLPPLGRVQVFALLISKLAFLHGDAVGIGVGVLADACDLP